MVLMQHAINLLGVSGGVTEAEALKRLKPGTAITRISWDGCMATERNVVAVGEVVRAEKHGRYEGVLVRYPKGEMWEPLSYIKFVGEAGTVEAWH